MAYSGLTITTTNAFGQKNIEIKNSLDQLVAVTDHLQGKITYEYHIDGQLSKMHSYHAGQSTSAATTVLEFDSHGRKTKMIDPDKGTWTYRYNAFGELIFQRDANLQTITQSYDRLGRMVLRTDRRANASVEGHTQWLYDNNTRNGKEHNNSRGQLRQTILSQTATQVSCGNANTMQCITYEYDSIGRQTASIVRLGLSGRLGTYRNETTYDGLGRAYIHYDALNSKVKNNGTNISGVRSEYNVHGYMYQSRDLATGDIVQTINKQNLRGQVLQETRANGVETHYRYDNANGRLLHQHTYTWLNPTDTNDIQHITYDWDALGNLRYRYNQSAYKKLKESFCYDGLNRLIKINLGTISTNNCSGLTAAAQDIEYNSIGNIIRKHNVGRYSYAHTYNTAASNDAGLHAVTSTSDGHTYRYDNNGNMILDSYSGGYDRVFKYTTFDKPYQITKGKHTTKFAYGVDRNRYWREDKDKNGVVTTTLYVGGVERISKSNSSTIKWKRYIGPAIYTVTTDQRDNQKDLEKLFVYKDHLGSTDVLTDENAKVIQSMSFDPWGQRRNAETWSAFSEAQLIDFDHEQSTKGFTGHEHLDEVGIIHMNGRIYDPRLGRFLQADPHIQAANDTQMLNRYSYVRNNPLNATDPSGYFLSLLVGIALKLGGAKLITAVVVTGIAAALEAAYAGASLGDALKAGVIAGLSAYAFSQIGQHFSDAAATNGLTLSDEAILKLIEFGGNELTAGQIVQQIALHGLVGGVSAELQGGKFGHGFFSAGFTKGVMGGANFNYDNRSAGAIFGRTLTAAIVGGTVSEATGGKFRNGAQTAAIAHLFNQEASIQIENDERKRISEELKEQIRDEIKLLEDWAERARINDPYNHNLSRVEIKLVQLQKALSINESLLNAGSIAREAMEDIYSDPPVSPKNGWKTIGNVFDALFDSEASNFHGDLNCGVFSNSCSIRIVDDRSNKVVWERFAN